MRRCLTTLVILALAFPIWGVPDFVMAASEINQQSTTEESRPVEDCQISDVAREAIENAQAASMQAASDVPEVYLLLQDLLLQAERAAKPPECDSVRAKTLADRAKGLAELNAINPKSTNISDTSNTSIDDQPIFTNYDGAWEFGLSAEIIEQKDIKGASFADTLFDDRYGLHIGKEFYKTERWFLGGQVHILKSNVDEIVEIDDVTFDATNIFVTARHNALPALQFKVGVSRAKYENFFESNSETGMVYGIALTSETDWGWRIHWLDYEVYKIGDTEFKSYSVNLIIVICFWGAIFGGGGSC